MPVQILLIEDSELDAELTIRSLRKSDLEFELKHVQSLKQIREELTEANYDIIISDYNLIDFSGEDAFELVRELKPHIPFIVQSGEINKKMELKLLSNKVTDVALKRNVDRLPFSVKRALNEKEDRDKLQENLRIQNAIAKTSLLFDSEEPLNTKIDKTLKLIGELTNASRVFVFEDYNQNQKSKKTHEWVADHAISQIDNIVDLNYADVPEWKEFVDKKEGLNIKDIEAMPASFQRILKPQNIKSILMHPIMIKGKQTGFIGISDTENYREWPEYHNKMLMTVSQLIGNAYKERDFITTLEKTNRSLQEALSEKDVLIGEIHHRVKNNLALISGFMELERFSSTSEKVSQVLTSNLLKIKSIGQIQELLYQSESFSKIPICPAISEIVEVFSLDHYGEYSFNFEKAGVDYVLNVNQATPLILLMSEILSEFLPKVKDEMTEAGNVFIDISCAVNADQFTLKISNPIIAKHYADSDSISSISGCAEALVSQLEAKVKGNTAEGCLQVSFTEQQMRGPSSSIE